MIDGEHYASVVRAALAELPYDVAAAYVCGGSEKLRPGGDCGVPLVEDLDAALDEVAPDVVVDLSDEPVLGPRARMRLVSRVLAAGVRYEGADFSFDPPRFAPFDRGVPSLAILGTGKRVGKTAVAGYVARLLSRDRELVVVAMGRGGPEQPELIDVQPTVESLLELSRSGRHAASDHLETAALAGVVTIGCRRCGGGLAGAVATSNVHEGAQLAAERSPDLVLFDGSGAAVPPVAVAKRLLVASAAQEPELVAGYLNAYRILISDLVVVTGAEADREWRSVVEAIREVQDVPVVATVLRPRPVAPLQGRRVAYFTTAPEAAHHRIAAHLAERHGVDLVSVSGNLSRRDALRDDLARARDADAWLVEIKAAAIDVVAEAADERGVEVVFAENDVEAVDGQPDLERELLALAEAAEAAAEPVRA